MPRAVKKERRAVSRELCICDEFTVVRHLANPCVEEELDYILIGWPSGQFNCFAFHSSG